MKKLMLSLFVAIMAATSMHAQQIAVVKENGSTSIHRTLKDAIEAATAGSVIYLPGGGFPIADDVKITKKVTIIGIGHKMKGRNADGFTTISGNLFFQGEAAGSALMGCYLTGNVNISVDDVLVRYCNVNSVQVGGGRLGTVINQNYIRNGSVFNGSTAKFTYNIAHSIQDLDRGEIENNIFRYAGSYWSGYNYALAGCDDNSIMNNVFLEWGKRGPCTGGNNQTFGNMASDSWGEGAIPISAGWAEVFKNPAGIKPESSYHFNEAYKEHEHTCGIYAGDTPFNDDALPPVPYIVSKSIPQQTDAAGMLNIQIRVKANAE